MKYKDCEYCGENKGIKCESCINYSNFREGFKVKNIDEQIEQAEKLVQAKKNQETEEEIKADEPQIIKMSLQTYECWLNKCTNQELEIEGLKKRLIGINDNTNNIIRKKDLEIQELQVVIKTLGGLL